MNPIKIFKNKTNGNLLKIYYDESAESPRDPNCFSNLGIMVCSHRRYKLGDIQIDSREELEEHLKDAVVSLNLFLYDHSGITMSTHSFNDQWDSGQVGIIYVSKENFKKEYGNKRLTPKLREQIIRILEGEVETYDQYLRGDVYGFIEYEVSKCNMEEEHEKLIESCWGYYGDIEDIIFSEGYKREEWEEVREVIA